MASMAKMLTLANLALEVGGMIAQGRGSKGSSPLLLLKYGLVLMLIVMTGVMGLTFLLIGLIYTLWPNADVVTVFASLGGVFTLACLGLLLYLGAMKRPFKEDPKPVLPHEPMKIFDAFLRGMNGH
jgi:drug/metabolite transporter superfamily protein YnfA